MRPIALMCATRQHGDTAIRDAMDIDSAGLRETYASLSTDALLQLHAAGGLTDEAYAVLESELESRSVAVPGRPRMAAPLHANRARSGLWATGFAAVGVLVPVICLLMDFEPAGLMHLCELCWPTGFLLVAAEGRFDAALVIIAIALNAAIWAGLGWLVGYASAGRRAGN